MTEEEKNNFLDSWGALVEECHSNSYDHGFWKGPEGASLPTKLMLIVSELGEALEADRADIKSSDHIPQFTGVEEEIADVIIRIADMAGGFGFRVGEAVLAKLAFNTSRPHKHGKNY